MATHVIVDGYNVIGHDGGLRGDLQARRTTLIRRLSVYQRIRGHRVTVVFDGWRAGWPSEHEEQIDRVTVIYSREGEQADDVIARLARVGGSAVVVVSSDRAVQAAVRDADGVALSCTEFERRLKESLVVGGEPGSGRAQADSVEEPETWSPPRVKKGNPRRRSKLERRKAAKLRKL
jgi:uncharacterized protein